MATVIPITLVGEDLGKRHFYLNSLVKETINRGEDFDVIKNLPEQSPIDRLFKIDLASKLRNVDYIIQNLKDDDMLYVSRALKSTWLIDTKYENIINPQYLEEKLYPEMITTAINKMQHWIHLNLKDEVRCRQFFQYYNEKNFELAIKFLIKCSKDDIQNEFLRVIHKMTPNYFKVVCENCPQAAKIFFDSIPTNDDIKSLYLDKEKDYFNVLRHLLKSEPDLVLDITEKYFNRDVFNRFSAPQTKFVMRYHKKRFWNKPELYTAWLLNTQAVANNLNSEEAKDLVIKLVRAYYLTYLGWSSYKQVEPFIKRLTADERVGFKKKVFVDKDTGEKEADWPYDTPKPPYRDNEYPTIFDDCQPEPGEYENLDRIKRPIQKKCCQNFDNYVIESCSDYIPTRTLLEKLFDEYRFVSFGQTLYDLRKRIAAESSPQNREFMMLVLVSKSGGRPDAIALLLELLARHYNEPPNVRAAIIRSLVKRASVWRLPEISWKQLLEFGQGLGLDGKIPVADCSEGLHAVVIRSLLLNGECEPAIQNAYLDQFSTLKDYSLSSTEQKVIAEALPRMLFSIAKEKDKTVDAVKCLDVLISTLNAYKIKLETYPGLIDTIVVSADKDISAVKYLIHSLFDAKIARKQFFRYTFDLVISGASYVNALRHDISIIDENKFAEYYVDGRFVNVDLFLRKLSIYFDEKNGLRNKFSKQLKAKSPTKSFGRPLAFLLKDELESYLNELDALKDEKSKLLASAIRANAHITRPPLDIYTFGWKKVGAKFIANRLFKCRSVEIGTNIDKLLKWKRTAKVALALAKRTTYESDVFIKFAAIKPTAAIKSGLKLVKFHGNKVDTLIWETVKPILNALDLAKTERRHIVNMLARIDEIPMKIRPEYSTVIYTTFKNISLYKAMPPLCHMEILLPDVDEKFVENLLLQFLKDDFTVNKLSTKKSDIKCTCMYVRILVKHILLSKTEEIQKRRLETFFDPFLAMMEEIRKSSEKKNLFTDYLPETLLTFKYNKVFLNTQYVSPLPVIETAVIWMQKLFSIDEHFKTFAQLHLCMLYYKAARQALKLVPEVFSDGKRKRLEGVKMVGHIFGKYIASEVNCLKTKYFDSIPELYIESVVAFLEKFTNDYISSDLIYSMIKGILENDSGTANRLGIYLLKDKYYDLKDDHSKELVKCLHELNNIETEWFVYAFLCNN